MHHNFVCFLLLFCVCVCVWLLFCGEGIAIDSHLPATEKNAHTIWVCVCDSTDGDGGLVVPLVTPGNVKSWLDEPR